MKILRVAICVMLIVGILAMSLSVFAVDWGDRVVAQEYLWAYYIYQFLHSIGIDVTYQGILEYTDEVQDTIIDWVVNYIADLIEADSQLSNYSIAQWIAPWQADYDYWGNLRFNSTMLEDMEDFADWLKSELSLIDNNQIVVNPVYTLGGYNLYNVNTWYVAEWRTTSPANSEYMVWRINVENYTGDLFVLPCEYTDSWGLVVMTDNGNITYNSQFQIKYSSNMASETLFMGNGMGNPMTSNIYGLKYWVLYGVRNQTFPLPAGGNRFVSDESMSGQLDNANSDLRQFMDVAKIQRIGDVAIVTATIMPPSIDPSYTEGDGVTIINGVPEYGVINIDDVTVDNLPAVITQNNIPDIGNDGDNPGFSVPWQYINGLIEYVAAPAGAIMALVNEAPVEGVIMLYALIGGIIIFGMIRIMREH